MVGIRRESLRGEVGEERRDETLLQCWVNFAIEVRRESVSGGVGVGEGEWERECVCVCVYVVCMRMCVYLSVYLSYTFSYISSYIS